MVLIATPASADVSLHRLFSVNAVLQRGTALPVWGTAAAGESIQVTLGTSQANTLAGEDGRWKVVLPPQNAASSVTLTVEGKNRLVVKNIAIGEVWLCAGQSNMGWPLQRTTNAQQEIDTSDFPGLRLFPVGKAVAQRVLPDVRGDWKLARPRHTGSFSAVAYYFGKILHQKLGVPVGLIQSSWGGMPAETWVTRRTLESSPELKSILSDWDRKVQNPPADLKQYETETLPRWQTAMAQAKAAGQPEPIKPNPPSVLDKPEGPSQLWNGMVAPLIPYAIKGTILFQGEHNVKRAEQYRTLFPALIRDWRNHWGQGDFPFFWVQLANIGRPQTEPVEHTPGNSVPMLREAQGMTLSLPRTGMATAIDLADVASNYDVHFPNKAEVGRRLALIALATEYEQNLPYRGPTFKSLQVEGRRARIEFGNTDGGLTIHGDKLRGFAIAGADGVWKWAEAAIRGTSVELSHPDIPAPVNVRYAWAANPIGNLYNGAGLPAYPFRTDYQNPQ